MMRTARRLALTAVVMMAVVVLTGCTHNDGDIGIWFGTWHVETITADGAAVDVDGDYFFQFQSSVFRVSLVQEHEQSVESYGTWSEDDGTMTISFPDASVYYLYVPGLETVNAMTVARQSSSRVTMTHTAGDGVKYVYELKKQP